MTRGKRTRPLIEPEPDPPVVQDYTAQVIVEMPNDVSVTAKQKGNIANLKPWQPGQSGNPAGRIMKTWKSYIDQLLPPYEHAQLLAADARRSDTIGAETRRWLAEQRTGKATAAIELSTSETDPAVQAMNRLAEVSRGLLATGSSTDS